MVKDETSKSSEAQMAKNETTVVALDNVEESEEVESTTPEVIPTEVKPETLSAVQAEQNQQAVLDQKAKEKTLITMMLANDDPNQKFGTLSLMDKILAEKDPFKTQVLVLDYAFFSAEDEEKILIKEIKVIR